MYGSGSSQLSVCLTPGTARLVGGQRLAGIFRHGVDVGVEGQRLFENQWSVGIVRTKHHGRNIRSAAGFQSILDAGDDGFLHPYHVILNGSHGFTQAYQKTDVGIVLNEGSYRLSGIVRNQWRDGTVAVLCLQTVMVGKGLAQDDVIEHLDDPDAAAVGLVGKEREDFLVLLERLLVHLQGEGIVLQLHQRGKGMTVPQVQRVVFVLHHHVEVFHPLLLVVEPREVLRGVRVFINTMTRQIDRLLQSDAGASHHHLGCFLNGMLRRHRNILSKSAGLTDAVCQFHAAIDDTRGIVARYHDTFLVLGYCVTFCCSAVCVRKRNLAVCFLGADGITHLGQLLLQVFCSILLTSRCSLSRLDADALSRNHRG